MTVRIFLGMDEKRDRKTMKITVVRFHAPLSLKLVLIVVHDCTCLIRRT